MQKDASTIRAELSMPFAPEDLEWRLQSTYEDRMKGWAVPYVTNRAIQDRLDDVVGPENWHNEFKPWHGTGKKEAQICGISIHFESRGYVTKWDGAEDTDIEAVKGGLSDSMKRAAVQWGVGRILYKMDMVWVDIEKRGKSWVIKDSERQKLDTAYLAMLKKLHLTTAKAGGVQSQLTPKSMVDPAPSAEPPKAPTPPKPTAAPIEQKVTQLPTAKAPVWEYEIQKINIQTGMNGQKTSSMIFRGQDGKELRVFSRNVHEDLRPGARLIHVKLAVKKQDTVVFYMLESYELVPAMQQAA